MNFNIKMAALAMLMLLSVSYAQTSTQGTPRPDLLIFVFVFLGLGLILLYSFLINVILFAIETDKKKGDLAIPIILIILGFLVPILLPIFAYIESKTAKQQGFFEGTYKLTYRIGKAGLYFILLAIIFLVANLVLAYYYPV